MHQCSRNNQDTDFLCTFFVYCYNASAIVSGKLTLCIILYMLMFYVEFALNIRARNY